MDLDPVREEFLADVSNFVNNIELAIEASRHFRDEVLADVEAIRAAIDSLPEERVIHIRTVYDNGAPDTGVTGDAFGNALAEAEAMQLAAASRDAGDSASYEALSLRELRDISASLIMVTTLLGASEEHLAAIQRDAADSSADLMMQTALLRDAQENAEPSIVNITNSTRNYNRALQDATNTGGNATRFWGVLPLTWNAIHWAITGTAEALAVIVPAMVALGSAGMVGLQGAVDVAQRMQAVYSATEATYSYLGKTVSTGLGQGLDSFTASAGQAANAGAHLHDELQQAQNAAQPRVYELLGAAIDGANSKFNVFNQVGSQTITMLDQFAAKIDVELKGPLGNLGQQISQNSVGDLQQLGQVFGNIGHAIAYAAGEMPGMANLLLTILDAGTQVLDWALHFQGVLEALFLAHEAYMWGGILQNVLGGITGALGKATTAVGTFAVRSAEMAGFESVAAGVDEAAVGMAGALESTAAFMAGPWGLAIGAAAVAAALLIPKLADAKTATEQWISSLEQAVSQATGLQQIGATYSALQQVTQANAEAQKNLGAAMSDSDNRISGVQERLSGPYTGAITEAAQKASDLSSAQQQLSQDWSTEIGNVQYLSSAYKIGYVSAAQLAADAGVSLTQTLKGNSTAAQIARQQITNLIAGYGGMASVSSELGQDINAVSLATEIQNGAVAKLNQAWDTFISLVQAPSSTFLSFAQSLSQFNQDAGQAGATMEGLGGSYTTASHNVDQAAVQLQQDFNTSVSSAEQMLDSMRTVAAVTGNGGPLVAGIKDAVAALIPMAGTNEAARAQMFAMAQEAGGPASGSLQALAKWAGAPKDPLTALYNLSMKNSAALQNLGQDTQALAATIQSTLNQALVSEAETLTQMPAHVAAYLTDLQKWGPASQITQGALDALNTSQSSANALATEGASAIPQLSGKVAQQGQAAADAHSPNQQYVSDIQNILNKAPGASTDINNLATAIQNHGLKSSAEAGPRQQLIKDLEAAGLKAQQATTDVDDLIREIGKIPHNVPVAINWTQTGTPPPQVTGIGSSGTVYKIGGHTAAEGWHVPGYGGGDTVPAMLEPGEAVVPKHLVPAVAPFLGAHHVPGFAAGGKVGHPWDMADVFALWGKEMWAHDLKGHGAGHPIPEAAMKALLASVTQPAKLSGIWDNPAWRDYAKDLKADMAGYSGKDLEYWTLMAAAHPAMTKARKAEIAHLEHEEHLHRLNHEPGWVKYYEKKLYALEHPETAKDAAELAMLKREGFASGGLVRSYDSGGYLPVGLSMAYNGTGKPEAVGGAGRSPQPLHVHLHMNGRQMAEELIPDLVGAIGDYGYMNSGRATGTLIPGG